MCVHTHHIINQSINQHVQFINTCAVYMLNRCSTQVYFRIRLNGGQCTDQRDIDRVNDQLSDISFRMLIFGKPKVISISILRQFVDLSVCLTMLQKRSYQLNVCRCCSLTKLASENTSFQTK